MCRLPLPLYHMQAASANALIQIRVGGNLLKAALVMAPPGTKDSGSPTAPWHRCPQPHGKLVWLCGSLRRLQLELPLGGSDGGPPATGTPLLPPPPALLQGGLKTETVLIRGFEGEQAGLLLQYDTPHYVATALPEDPLLYLGYRARALRKDAN